MLKEVLEKQYYYYYHCSSACGCRYKADDVNSEFLNGLKRYEPLPKIAELCEEVIRDLYNNEFATKGDGRNDILRSIAEMNGKVSRGRELLPSGDIDGNDFRLIKTECEAKITRFEAKLSELSVTTVNIDFILNKATKTLSNLASMYKNGSISLKREIIGSMYPEKLTFDGKQHRTARINEAAQLMYQISSRLGGKKRRASDEFSCLPTVANLNWLEPKIVGIGDTQRFGNRLKIKKPSKIS